MDPDHGLLPRYAEKVVLDALEDTRVVVLSGPRQSGKSTLAKIAMGSRPGAALRYLDDDATRMAAAADPTLFVRHDGLLVIDEIQRVPDLMLAIKHQVDIDPRPGRFLLTGSARLFSLCDIPDLLPGRSETVELWPLSQGEIDRTESCFVDAAFTDGANIAAARSPWRRQDYIERALRGGYPEAVRRHEPRRRGRFFESYIRDLINRDVRQVSDIERPADMRKLLNTVASSMASLWVPGNFANRLQLPAKLTKRYLELLELVYVLQRIPAWSNNLTTRAIASEKLVLTDSGLAGHLIGMSAKRAAHPTAPVGPLIENFVLGELTRQLGWSEEPVTLFHYRDRDQYEVDAILERASGEIVAIEVKAAETVRLEDFRGIRRVASRAGGQFLAGFVLYCGEQPLPFGDRLRAIPLSTLWGCPER